LLIPASEISDTMAMRQFSGMFFEVKETYMLPEFARRHFKFPGNAYLPAGRYPVRQEEQYFTIYLEISV